MTDEGTGPSRRSFLSRLMAGTLFVWLAGACAAVAAYLFPPDAAQSSLGPRRVRVGAVDDILLGEGRLTLVDEEPVWVVRLAHGFVALSAWCTHQGCIVKWDGQKRSFDCPCHDGRFDDRGNVVAGLPLRSLTRFRVGVVDHEVYVSRIEGEA
jgi:Rieske Fe-S protein